MGDAMAKQEKVFLLTTTDNPYDPFKNFKRWYIEDIRLGYNTCGLLSRFTSSADVFNEDAEIAAMRDIVKYNFSGKHIVVVPEDFTPLLNLSS